MEQTVLLSLEDVATLSLSKVSVQQIYTADILCTSIKHWRLIFDLGNLPAANYLTVGCSQVVVGYGAIVGARRADQASSVTQPAPAYHRTV